MGTEVARDADAVAAWGIERGYRDTTGQWREAPAVTLQAVQAAVGKSAPTLAGGPMVVVGEEGPWPDLPAGTLALEHGGSVELGPEAADARPERLPLGYHRLLTGRAAKGAAGGAEEPLLVAVCPERCPAPPSGPVWGWSVQLYAARSGASWGVGDFSDLAALAEWAGGHGASFLLLNPLHAPAPGPAPEPSPYFPSSRCFLNPLYICVPDVPGAPDLPEFGALCEKGQALNAERLIDRAAVWACKREALEALFARFEESGGDPRFERYIAERGRVLDSYTSFCAISELHGLPWQDWPQRYRRPDSPAVAELASTEEGYRRKRYYQWLQWTCERQLLRAAGKGTGLVLDLAVGVDGGGADAWLWQDVFALGMRAGAPPDDFNPDGQDWGLPPWDPWRLRSACYEPYVETLRATLRAAKGLRVDHVMGLFRLFWVPLGSQPRDGAYVRSIWQETLALLRLEAERAGAFVVGEDLGTVEQYVREALSGSGVLSYRLFWFEDRPPAEWPVQALGAVTTHDLPTVAGVWTGTDGEAERRLGRTAGLERSEALRRRLSEWTGSSEYRPVAEVIEATYAALARAPCSLLAAVLDDAVAVEERPNMPGTLDKWPNWCLALPVPLEAVVGSGLAEAIAGHLGNRGRTTP